MSTPKIFISYSHDSPEHEDFVLSLSERLREGGLNCTIDKDIAFPSEGWPIWIEKQIETADFVLILFTPVYLRLFRKEQISGEEKKTVHEGAMITQSLYENCCHNTRFIPLIPDAGEESHIPMMLRGYTCFKIPSQYEALYRLLTGQPEVLRPPLGQKKILPPRKPAAFAQSQFPQICAKPPVTQANMHAQTQASATASEGAVRHILHLSDLHFDIDTRAAAWYSQLADDLRYELGCTSLDVLILSGDIAKHSTPEEYAAAKIFLDELCREFQLDRTRIVIVPGNHDLNWKLAEEACEIKRCNACQESADDMAIDREAGIRDKAGYARRFMHFEAFYRSVTGSAYPRSYAQQGILYHYPALNLLILGLNSAWQLDHRCTKRAGIHPDALSNALTQIRQNPAYTNCIKFAVWHHPLYSAFTDCISDDGFMERLAQAGFCAALHGHIHKADNGVYRYDQSIGGRQLHLISAGTFGAPVREWMPGYPLQYNLLKLQDNVLTVETRRREKLNGAWKPDARWLQGSGQDPKPRYVMHFHSQYQDKKMPTCET